MEPQKVEIENSVAIVQDATFNLGSHQLQQPTKEGCPPQQIPKGPCANSKRVRQQCVVEGLEDDTVASKERGHRLKAQEK
eukprot:CAMPEP_0116540848 /NCGR_PEP_ID=MMETSP0397-20121206/168_1 /TAXON_ID=216820 /ORGANISM="Cyclophora tenuis, Strain ECT3854" /LENGTH=79 /DNA_ID=CAMNT_0004064751 /DNA_START=503 /DNA_END=742 /DNA_ORIENTATION=+